MKLVSREEIKTLVEQPKGNSIPGSQSVSLHQEEETGDEDLLDLAAAHTLINGGSVYVVEPEKVPFNKPVAAIFRYS